MFYVRCCCRKNVSQTQSITRYRLFWTLNYPKNRRGGRCAANRGGAAIDDHPFSSMRVSVVAGEEGGGGL